MKLAASLTGLGLAAGVAACAHGPAHVASSLPLMTVSRDGYETTIARLDAAVAARPLKVFAVIDHAAGAAGTSTALPPSRLLVVGNPEAGTPFMVANPAFGHELPLRILVYVENGATKLAWTDIRSMSGAYGISPEAAPVEQVAAVLEAIVAEAAGREAGTGLDIGRPGGHR